MGTRVFSRWQASGLHLLISASIAALSLVLILGLWFPGALFEAAGGLGLLYLLVGVGVVLRPLPTLRGLKSARSAEPNSSSSLTLQRRHHDPKLRRDTPIRWNSVPNLAMDVNTRRSRRTACLGYGIGQG